MIPQHNTAPTPTLVPLITAANTMPISPAAAPEVPLLVTGPRISAPTSIPAPHNTAPTAPPPAGPTIPDEHQDHIRQSNTPSKQGKKKPVAKKKPQVKVGTEKEVDDVPALTPAPTQVHGLAQCSTRTAKPSRP